MIRILTILALCCLPLAVLAQDEDKSRLIQFLEETLSEGGFADIESLAAQCRFNDCKHQQEPGCAVRAAIDAGEIEESRLLNYFKLKEEVAAAAAKLAVRQAETAQERSGRKGKGQQFRPAGKPRRR